MHVNRQNMLQMTAAAGTLALLQQSRATRAAGDFTVQQLDAAAAAPVLKREQFASPVIVDSIELLRGERDYFVRVRSRDGAEGISVTNSRRLRGQRRPKTCEPPTTLFRSFTQNEYRRKRRCPIESCLPLS